MTLFDTPLGEDLTRALEERLDQDISTAVTGVLDAVWARQLDENQVQEAIGVLEDHARFVDALLVGDAAMARGLATFETRRRYCQTLIETGALHASEVELTRIIAEDGISDLERGEAIGLLGRLRKQRFVRTGETSDLRAALEAYEQAFSLGTDPAWHGVNLLALLTRSETDGVSGLQGLPDREGLATDLLALVRAKPANQRDVWERTTEVEVLISVDRVDEAREVAEQLTASRSFNPFHLGSLRRQLTEIWRLPETHPVILALSDQLLQHGHRAVVDIPDTPEQFEKVFGAALPIGYHTLLKGLRCAESVCKITDVNGDGWGTGFLIDGAVLSAELAGEVVVATNAHVVSAAEGVGVLKPVEAEARFDVLKGAGGDQVRLTAMTELWTSPPTRCDVTLLSFDTDHPVIPEPITRAPELPHVNEGAFVYVVGHPAGAGLKLSIRGNDLLAYDEARYKVHYTAPTEPGSSGSPVFTPQWQLMAVHHAGSARMRRLDDTSQTYEANEGITLISIRAELESG